MARLVVLPQVGAPVASPLLPLMETPLSYYGVVARLEDIWKGHSVDLGRPSVFSFFEEPIAKTLCDG